MVFHSDMSYFGRLGIVLARSIIFWLVHTSFRFILSCFGWFRVFFCLFQCILAGSGFFWAHSRICFGRFCSVAVGSSGFFGQFYGVSASLFPFLVSLVLLQPVLIFFGQIKIVFVGLVLLQLVQTVFWLV